MVAPPRGERGLKLRRILSKSVCHPRRSPSWGAWIETPIHAPPRPARQGRSPSWGAWIETHRPITSDLFSVVAPPRGERGLKHLSLDIHISPARRSPSWGAWIETFLAPASAHTYHRRSPSWGAWIETPSRAELPTSHTQSLPLVGSVD